MKNLYESLNIFTKNKIYLTNFFDKAIFCYFYIKYAFINLIIYRHIILIFQFLFYKKINISDNILKKNLKLIIV